MYTSDRYYREFASQVSQVSHMACQELDYYSFFRCDTLRDTLGFCVLWCHRFYWLKKRTNSHFLLKTACTIRIICYYELTENKNTKKGEKVIKMRKLNLEQFNEATLATLELTQAGYDYLSYIAETYTKYDFTEPSVLKRMSETSSDYFDADGFMSLEISAHHSKSGVPHTYYLNFDDHFVAFSSDEEL